MDDRVLVMPESDGNHTLPCDSLFNNLIARACQPGPNIAIRDVNCGIERTFAQLLSHVVHLRNVLRSRLPRHTRNDLCSGGEVYISLLAPGGYEFAVGALAILALGAAISPISPAQPVSEALYYVTKSRSVAVLTAQSANDKGQALARSSKNQDFIHVCISAVFDMPVILPTSLLISSTNITSPTKPALVIFTSGTTGPPKGGVLRHGTITDTSLAWALQKDLKPGNTLLHLLPVHHATGIWVSFFPFLLSGACIEFRSGSFDPAWTWERWRKGSLTHFSGVPTIYMRMMRYYHDKIAKLPHQERRQYRSAAKSFKVCMCGTSALPEPINDFWTKMLGKRIIQRYGLTEAYVVFEMPLRGSEDVPDGSVGRLLPGIDLKLIDDNGNGADEGEVRVRSPHMFSKYLYDDNATKAAYDADGYFRTGDIARREGDYYFIVGRASVDIIKSGGYKISALDIEREILALPYISEAMVVGVQDDEFGQRVAAAVSLRDDETARRFSISINQERGREALKLDDLRSDLRARLAGYKLPTLLRVIEGELPKSATGKVVKKALGPEYFPPNYRSLAEVQVWDREESIRSKL